MSRELPWEYHPDLAEDRLVIIARCIEHAYDDAIGRHDETIGDNGWTFGCTAFQFCRFRITKAIDSKKHEWLGDEDRSPQFIFRIGEISVRFYKGDAEDPNVRTMRRTFPELKQLDLAFPDEEARRLLYRFAIEVDIDGSILAIKFVGLLGERVPLCWDIPYKSSIVSIPPLAEAAAEGVELPAPLVEIPGEEQERKDATA